MAVATVCHRMLSLHVACIKMMPPHSQIYRCIVSNVLPGGQQDSSDKSNTSVNQQEVDKFRSLASQWWDPSGDFKALHSFNTLRIPLVRDGILQTRKVPKEIANSSRPLKNFNIIDVGCGGGVLSEPLSRLGANVTGIDPAEECISIANQHLAKDSSLTNLKYLKETAEQHVASSSDHYDAVILSEVAEHADNLKLLMISCINLLKADGSIFVTTINQTFSAWILAILVAENVLRVLPPGTHDYKKLVRPEDLEQLLLAGGCQVHLVHGMMYNPFCNSWHWTKDTSINYAMHAVKRQHK